MANYNETDVTGTEYQRCFSVVINNVLNQIPEIIFKEEKVLNLSTGKMSIGCGYCAKQYNADSEFSILNIADNTDTGSTMTHKDLYIALYSLYVQTAAERDKGN